MKILTLIILLVFVVTWKETQEYKGKIIEVNGKQKFSTIQEAERFRDRELGGCWDIRIRTQPEGRKVE